MNKNGPTYRYYNICEVTISCFVSFFHCFLISSVKIVAPKRYNFRAVHLSCQTSGLKWALREQTFEKATDVLVSFCVNS